MFTVKNGSIPDAFKNKIHLISHDHFTKKSMCSLNEHKFSLKQLNLQFRHVDHVSRIKS